MGSLATRMKVLGSVSILLGILAMMAPGFTGMSVLSFLGFLVLVGGVLRIVWAFGAGSLRKGLLQMAIGLLTLICGLVLIAHPVITAGLLSVLVGLYLLVDGIAEIAAGFRLRPQSGSGWLIVGGIVSVLLGVMIWRQFPLSGAWALGILLGIKMFFVGLIMLMGGSVLKSVTKA
jgi:uncharacterized membrane protein HdeD (DUF308 family)